MDNIHEYIRALEIPWISYEYGYAPDIEGRCLGSSIQKLSPGKEKIQKKRENKGDSGELYNIQYTAYQVWETFTFLRSCANRYSYTLALSQSSIKFPAS